MPDEPGHSGPLAADAAISGGVQVDVLVVGGGIVGAGVARDAAMRGLSVGLVEQADFASGTSSRTSRLLHGGLRYLAQGRLGLVREASREKKILGHIAPHLVQPLAFLFPTRRRGDWPKWQLRIGVKIYDLLCGGENFGPSRTLSAREMLDLLPGLDPTGLNGGVRYFDALTVDARLVLDTLRSAAHHGAGLRNYARLASAERSGSRWICLIEDRRTRQTHRMEARTVVNATGPWSDKLPASSIRLRRTKGVHLVVDRQRLPVPDAVVMPEGKRILFAIPWGERLILGTTDTDYDGPLDRPTCQANDVRYVLDVTNAAFPTAKLTEADVFSTWAGLRPLVADSGGGPSDISRRHEIRRSQPGWWDVAGGKLTTYRLMAEQTVDQIGRELKARLAACRTAEEPLVEASQAAGVSGITPPPLGEQLVKHYCNREWAARLEDVMVRRTGWRYCRVDQAPVAERVAQWMAEALDWDTERKEAELRNYSQETRA